MNNILNQSERVQIFYKEEMGMSSFGLVIISAAILIALYFLTRKLFNETKKKAVILWTGLVLFFSLDSFPYMLQTI